MKPTPAKPDPTELMQAVERLENDVKRSPHPSIVVKSADIRTVLAALDAGRMDAERIEWLEQNNPYSWVNKYIGQTWRTKISAALAVRNQSADGAEREDLGRAIHDLGEITPEANNP